MSLTVEDICVSCTVILDSSETVTCDTSVRIFVQVGNPRYVSLTRRTNKQLELDALWTGKKMQNMVQVKEKWL